MSNPRFRYAKGRPLSTVLGSALLTLLPWGTALAQSDSFPGNAITVVVPIAAGATATQIRVLASCMSTALGGTSVIVENKPGAGGAIGTTTVRNAKPDGYTLLFIATPVISVVPHLTPATYTLGDFAPVGNLSGTPMLMAARQDAPFKTFEEMLKYARSNPNAINFASGGVGTSMHLTGVELQAVASLEFTHVPFQGGAPALNAVISGVADVIIAPPSLLTPMIEAGRLRPLVLFGDTRYKHYPNVPTARESGVDVVENLRSGLLAPRNVPKPVLAKLESAFKSALEDPRCIGALEKADIDISYLNAAQFEQDLQQQVARYNRLFANPKFSSRVQ